MADEFQEWFRDLEADLRARPPTYVTSWDELMAKVEREHGHKMMLCFRDQAEAFCRQIQAAILGEGDLDLHG